MDLVTDWTALPLRWKMVAVATAVVLVEVAFRRLAPRSRAYARWTAGFEAIGAAWTAVILAAIYVLSVGPTGMIIRALRGDLLDRRLAPEPTFWRAHEPNPLGPAAAARHQF
jgi:hypothetical protein